MIPRWVVGHSWGLGVRVKKMAWKSAWKIRWKLQYLPPLPCRGSFHGSFHTFHEGFHTFHGSFHNCHNSVHDPACELRYEQHGPFQRSALYPLNLLLHIVSTARNPLRLTVDFYLRFSTSETGAATVATTTSSAVRVFGTS